MRGGDSIFVNNSRFSKINFWDSTLSIFFIIEVTSLPRIYCGYGYEWNTHKFNYMSQNSLK